MTFLLFDLVPWPQRTEEMEALQCRIRDEHEIWKIEEEELEIKEIEGLDPLGERYSV